MPRRDPGEDFVEGLRAAHLLDLLEHHRRQLAVALGEDGVSALGQREEQRRAAAAAPLRLAHDQAISLQVGEVLTDGVRRHAEVAGDSLRAAAAPAPQQLEDLHAGRTAGDQSGPHSGRLRAL